MSLQNWNAENYQKHASFVPTLADDVLDLLNAQKHEKVLDLGCGDGQLTQKIVDLGSTVVGIDASESMVVSTIERGIEAYVIDGHELKYDAEFDAVFTNATLHWLKQPKQVINGVYKALKQNGRFVGEFGGYGNVGSLIKVMQEVFNENKDFGEFKNPWFFPTVKEYKSLLEQQNFEVRHIELIARPTTLKSGMGEWLSIFAQGITNDLYESQKIFFKELCINKLKPIMFSEENGWVADYVRLRFQAIKI